MPSEIRSYTSLRDSGVGRLDEFGQLFKKAMRGDRMVEYEVRWILDLIRRAEALVVERTGTPIENLQALEIGPGQIARQTAYFAMRNEVTVIDLDVAPHGLNLPAYWRLWRRNGTKRLLKTLARKLLRVDAHFNAQMRRQLGVARLPNARVLQMDAMQMSFPEDSFDFVYSFDTFEHLSDPLAVLREVRRVLRQGGRCLTVLHPYTCDTGCHDMRLFMPGRANLPMWPHLRPESKEKVGSFVYLNRWTLAQWHDAFAQVFPNTSFDHWQLDEGTREALAQIRAAGELANYSDEDLLTDRLVAVSTK